MLLRKYAPTGCFKRPVARLYLASVTLDTADFDPLDLAKISLMLAQIVTLVNNQVVIYLSLFSVSWPHWGCDVTQRTE